MSAAGSARSVSALSFLGVGFSFLAEVGLCAGLGYWLDGLWGTDPWALTAGVALGMTVAIMHLLRAAARFEAQDREADDSKTTNGKP